MSNQTMLLSTIAMLSDENPLCPTEKELKQTLSPLVHTVDIIAKPPQIR